MPDRQRDVVKPPNQNAFKGDHRANGFLPLTGTEPAAVAPNLSIFLHGDAGGSADMIRRVSPVSPANPRLRSGDPGYTAQPDSATEPGHGAVPVNPFLARGPGLARAIPIADDAAGPPGSFPSRL